MDDTDGVKIEAAGPYPVQLTDNSDKASEFEGRVIEVVRPEERSAPMLPVTANARARHVRRKSMPTDAVLADLDVDVVELHSAPIGLVYDEIVTAAVAYEDRREVIGRDFEAVGVNVQRLGVDVLEVGHERLAGRRRQNHVQHLVEVAVEVDQLSGIARRRRDKNRQFRDRFIGSLAARVIVPEGLTLAVLPGRLLDGAFLDAHFLDEVFVDIALQVGVGLPAGDGECQPAIVIDVDRVAGFAAKRIDYRRNARILKHAHPRLEV